MTYETTIAGDAFFPFVKAVTDFVGDAKVIFDEYILISTLDTAGVMFIDSAVRNPNPPPEPIEVILDLRSIVGVTSVKNDVSIRIMDPSRVQIETGRMTYTLPTIIDPSLKNRKIPEKVYPVQLRINTSAFIEGIKGMIAANKAIEELKGFWFIAEGEDMFYFQDALKQHCVAAFAFDEEYKVMRFDSPASSMFSIDYLEDMIKHLKEFDEIVLSIATNVPMVIVASTEERKLAYALACRIEKK